MAWLFVIEENQALFEQIEDAIAQIEPKLEIVRVLSSKEFLERMKGLTEKVGGEPNAVPVGPFLGLITSVESWSFKDVRLIGRFKKLFVQRRLAKSEEDLSVVFTAYESKDLEKKRFENRAVNNLLFKPFDKLVLRQMIEIAFTGRHPVKKYFVHNFKLDAKVEMLKQIKLTGLTELGFRTVAEEQLAPGRTAKYYADFLETRQHRSALAQVLHLAAKRKASSSGSDLYDAELRFFALDQQQSFNLQRLVRESNQRKTFANSAPGPETFEFLFVQHEKDSLIEEIRPSIERFFDHPVRICAGLAELEKKIGADAGRTRFFVFLSARHFNGDEPSGLEALHQLAPQAMSIFVLSQKIFPEALELALSQLCEDIFYAPFNRSYVIKGLKQRWPSLKTNEDLFQSEKEYERLIHASNPVKILKVSEAGLVIEYHRALPVGSFREFVFWSPVEVNVPTLVAQCNFAQPVSGAKTFHCHFVFFGLHEVELKHIRLWMLHEYVESKKV